MKTPRSKSAAVTDSILQLLVDVGDKIDTLIDQDAILDLLITKGEARRLDRTEKVQILGLKRTPYGLLAQVAGENADYYTKIIFQPRGHHCTCPDWQQRGRQVGPCKHVLALARTWKAKQVAPNLEKAEQKLTEILGTLP